MDNQKMHCCSIDCNNLATFHVQYTKQFEDYSHYCDNHILDNLSRDNEMSVIPLKKNEAVN